MPRIFDNIETHLLPALQETLKVYHPTAQEREPLATGRMLVITACPPTLSHTTRETALGRNKLVLALTAEICAPHIAEHSPLAGLLRSTVTHPPRPAPHQ
jgi:hypothetical protein